MKLMFEIYPSIHAEQIDIILRFTDEKEITYTSTERLSKELAIDIVPRCIDKIFYEAKRKVKEKLLEEKQPVTVAHLGTFTNMRDFYRLTEEQRRNITEP